MTNLEEVKKILREWASNTLAHWYNCRVDVDTPAQQICRLFPQSVDNPDEPKSETDYGRTQQVGNKNEANFTLSCVLCGDIKELTLTAHRSMSGKVCGWLVSCISCQPKLCDFHFVDAKTASIKDAECQQKIEEIRVVLQTLVDRYWCNQEEDYDRGFIACITPRGIPEYWKQARQALKDKYLKKELDGR